MFASLRAVLLLPLLLLHVGPIHVQASRSSRAGWLEHQMRWCLEDHATVECDEASIIRLYSAFYSGGRKLKGRAEKCQRVDIVDTDTGTGEGEEDCPSNFTDDIWAKCHQLRSCRLEPSSHPSACAKRYLSMRIIWDCEAGSPRPKAEVGKKEPVLVPGEEEEEEEDGVHPPKQENHDPEEKAVKLVQDISKEAEHNITFTPCWRKAKSELSGILAILPATNCPKDEGCFRLSWPDGRAFGDINHPPLGTDLVEASLQRSSRPIYSMKEWNTLDLEWNNERTWGICLPKKRGMKFAVGVFNALQTQHKDRLAEELKKNPQGTSTFVPCWRHDEKELLGVLGILPATNCPKTHGCFMLTFPGGKIFADEKHPPVLADAKTASLSVLLTDMRTAMHFAFSMALSQFGPVNLKHNLPNTWGVCLPSMLGTSFARAAFSAMKSLP